jgi:hypothetical protein
MSIDLRFRDVARLYDIRDILHLNGKQKVIVCPLPQHVHHHRTPSFSIFTSKSGVQKWHCFGSCGLYGDAIDLAGFIFVPGYRKDDKDKVREAIALLTGHQINPPKPEPVKQATLNNGLYKRYMPAGQSVMDYARQRFLTSETLEHFCVGQKEMLGSQWMTMPTLHGGQLRGIKMRNVSAADKSQRYRSIEGSVDGLFNFNAVNDTTLPVIIAKGEIAVMILSQFGILACAPTGGEASYYKHEELLKPLAFSRKRVVVGDNDTRLEVREKMVQAAVRRKEIFRADLHLPPDPFVGIDDWIIAEPTAAVPLIKSWLK